MYILEVKRKEFFLKKKKGVGWVGLGWSKLPAREELVSNKDDEWATS
jgi:hypothetical protein